MTKPYISIVLCGRNDNHNGDFDFRAELALRHNIALLNKFHIDFDIVWVEWNPISGRPLFFDNINNWCSNCQCFVVPAEIHQAYCQNPSINVMQFHAKNTGIRRASGQWILSMNADTYLSFDIVQKISAIDSFDKNCCYLANRINIPTDFLEKISQSNIDYPLTCLSLQDDSFQEVFKNNGKDYGAPGDFTFMSKSLWQELDAYFEGVCFSNHHIDTLLCKKLELLGKVIECIGNVYHVDHEDAFIHMKKDENHHHGGNDYPWNHVKQPYQNNPDWGLATCKEKTISCNVTELYQTPSSLSRPDDCTNIISWDRFNSMLLEAFDYLKKHEIPTLLFGYGSEIKEILKDNNDSSFIIGCLDDPLPESCPYTKYTFEDVNNNNNVKAILLGSCWWAYDLAKSVKVNNRATLLYPLFFRHNEK